MNENILSIEALQKTAREAVAKFPDDEATQEEWAFAVVTARLDPKKHPQHEFLLELISKPESRAEIRAALIEARADAK